MANNLDKYGDMMEGEITPATPPTDIKKYGDLMSGSSAPKQEGLDKYGAMMAGEEQPVAAQTPYASAREPIPEQGEVSLTAAGLPPANRVEAIGPASSGIEQFFQRITSRMGLSPELIGRMEKLVGGEPSEATKKIWAKYNPKFLESFEKRKQEKLGLVPKGESTLGSAAKAALGTAFMPVLAVPSAVGEATDTALAAAGLTDREKVKAGITPGSLAEFLALSKGAPVTSLIKGGESRRVIQGAMEKLPQAGVMQEFEVYDQVKKLLKAKGVESPEVAKLPETIGLYDSLTKYREGLKVKDIIEKAGLRFDGVNANKHMMRVLFTDPQTGDSLAMPLHDLTPESLAAHLAESRAKYPNLTPQEIAKHVEVVMGKPGVSSGQLLADLKNSLRKQGVMKPVEEIIGDELAGDVFKPYVSSKALTRLTELPPTTATSILAERFPEKYANISGETPLARVLQRISIGKKGKLPYTVSDFYTDYFDRLHPLDQLVKETVGKGLPVGEDPYKMARMLPGWWGKASSWLEYKPFNFETYKFDGKGLRDILLPAKSEEAQLSAYLTARRVPELARRGIVTGISVPDAQATVKQLGGRFGAIAKDLDAYNDRLLNYLKDADLLSAESILKIKAANELYIPFNRVTESLGTVTKKAAGMQARAPYKEIVGGTQEIIDPVESVIHNTYVAISLAERNAVGKSLITLAEKNPGLASLVKHMPKETATIFESKAADALREANDPEIVRLLQLHLPNDSLEILRKGAFTPREDMIAVWINGKRELYQVHPDIAAIFQGTDQEQMKVLEKVLSYPARWLRAGATTLSPEFVPRNIFRDQFTAWINTKYGYVPGYDFVKGIFHASKQDELFWQWKIGGGEHSMLVSLDRVQAQKQMGSLLKDTTFSEIAKNPLKSLQIASEFGEEGTRIGEFARGVKKLGTTKKAIQEAAFSSREVSVDFGRIGAKTKAWNSIVAFFNANLQGIDREVRQLHDHPASATAKIVSTITVPSVLLAAANHGDGRWEDIPQVDKDMKWIFMSGYVSREDWANMSSEEKAKFNLTHPIRTLPKPWEVGIVFGSIPERATQFILDKDPKAFDGILSSVGNALVPSWMPTAVVPFYEAAANKSTFTGKPIVPKSQEQLLPRFQVSERTSETAKIISKAISKIPQLGEEGTVSPTKLDNFTRAWTGGFGKYALQAADMALKATGVTQPKEKPAERWPLAESPVVKAFSLNYPPSGPDAVNQFYENYGTAQKYFSTGKHLLKYGDVEGAEFINENAIRLTGIRNALSTMHQITNLINANPRISSEDKRMILDRVTFDTINLAKQGNKIYDRIQVNMKGKK